MSDAVAMLSESNDEQVQIAIGPEGGFSDSEIAPIAAKQVIGLGPRILRTETAATAVLAVLFDRLGA